ncbi:MAG: hypothetical protein P0Y56_05425 [Candidatus Andeanibacterium colombiense]|uniref:Protein TonB n=1 Tax=Candidatus Andeanibacterium colombiense TaxID=3121345 RepID=A0AAJ5XBH6_9SPHN|nr:MAG: hypothetical protein P0Y56_05425 [Sphingomonadaceae bacterium]
MFQPDYVESVSLTERLRAQLGRRSLAVIVTLLIEVLILLAIWSLGQSSKLPEPQKQVVTTFDAKEPPPDRPVEKPREDKQAPPQETRMVAPQPAPQPIAPPVPPAPPKPAFIPISPKQMAQADISDMPKGPPLKPGAPVYGPVFTGTSTDSKRVGTAPDGQPMYAAAWYRRPAQSELEGYLSTAEHPGWATIGCKTAPDYRVEKCVLVDEYPDHSNYGRAVLAAAWQFKVRPPRLGGKELVGAWVQIKIYDETGHTKAY